MKWNCEKCNYSIDIENEGQVGINIDLLPIKLSDSGDLQCANCGRHLKNVV